MGIVLPDAFVEIARAKDASLAGEAAAVMPEEVVDHTVLAGNAEHVADRLARVSRPEIDSITVRPHRVPGEPVEAVIRGIRERGHAPASAAASRRGARDEPLLAGSSDHLSAAGGPLP